MRAKKARRKGLLIDKGLYIMMIPALILVVIYSYGPLFGLVMAFQRYDIARGIFGSPFIGLENFRYLFINPNFPRVIWNTVFMSAMKLVFRFIVPIIVALLLNEVQQIRFKRTIQTVIYLPYFVSWVALSGVFINLLSPSDRFVNEIIKALGGEPIYFLGEPKVFPWVMIITDTWKEFGYGTIIYMAALTSIDPSLYEAACIDGASRFQRAWHITIPGLVPIMVLNGILSLGGLLNAGFDQVYNLYNPLVYSTGDILDTYVYRIGMQEAQYDVATAVGLIKSGVSLVLVSASYFTAYKVADYRIF